MIHLFPWTHPTPHRWLSITQRNQNNMPLPIPWFISALCDLCIFPLSFMMETYSTWPPSVYSSTNLVLSNSTSTFKMSRTNGRGKRRYSYPYACVNLVIMFLIAHNFQLIAHKLPIIDHKLLLSAHCSCLSFPQISSTYMDTFIHVKELWCLCIPSIRKVRTQRTIV